MTQSQSPLERLRLRAGLSKAELARRAGVDETTVTRAETGQRVQAHKASLIAQAISQAVGEEFSTQDLGIVIYP
jgi:transcriptional regulator with XRE-family HTH domain